MDGFRSEEEEDYRAISDQKLTELYNDIYNAIYNAITALVSEDSAPTTEQFRMYSYYIALISQNERLYYDWLSVEKYQIDPLVLRHPTYYFDVPNISELRQEHKALISNLKNNGSTLLLGLTADILLNRFENLIDFYEPEHRAEFLICREVLSETETQIQDELELWMSTNQFL